MGYLFLIIASVLFGTVPSIQEYVIRQGASPLGLVILCNGAAGIAALIAGLLRGESFRFGRHTLAALAVTGGVGLFLTDFLLNLAYARIPVGLTTMLHFLYPTVVSLGMMSFFGEKVRWFKVAAIAVSLAGLFCLFGGSMIGNLPGMLAALGSAFCYAFYIIRNDRPPLNQTPLMSAAFYINLSSVIPALVIGGITKTASIPLSPLPLLLGALAGVMLCAGLILMAAGIQRLGASKAAFLNMLEPITSLLISSLVTHTLPAMLTVFGSLLILASLTLYTRKD